MAQSENPYVEVQIMVLGHSGCLVTFVPSNSFLHVFYKPVNVSLEAKLLNKIKSISRCNRNLK